MPAVIMACGIVNARGSGIEVSAVSERWRLMVCYGEKTSARSVSRNSPREIVARGFRRTIFSPNITMASIKGFRPDFHWDDFLGRPARARGVKRACLLASRQTSSNWVGPSENVSRSAFSFSRRISGFVRNAATSCLIARDFCADVAFCVESFGD